MTTQFNTTAANQNLKISQINGIKIPQSYMSQDAAFDNGNGDNFFKFNDGSIICISKNDKLFIELINAGYKTMLMQYLDMLQK